MTYKTMEEVDEILRRAAFAAAMAANKEAKEGRAAKAKGSAKLSRAFLQENNRQFGEMMACCRILEQIGACSYFGAIQEGLDGFVVIEYIDLGPTTLVLLEKNKHLDTPKYYPLPGAEPVPWHKNQSLHPAGVKPGKEATT